MGLLNTENGMLSQGFVLEKFEDLDEAVVNVLIFPLALR